MDRIFDFKKGPALRVFGDDKQLRLTRADSKAQKELITKTHINKNVFYADEFVSFPATKIIEKKTQNGSMKIVFGDMEIAYGNSTPERYILIEENGCKFALKKGNGHTNGIFRLYGDILGALQMGKNGLIKSTTAKKYVKELGCLKPEKILSLYRRI